MNSSSKQLEKYTKQKLKEFGGRIQTSFVLIRQDLDDMQSVIDSMKIHIKKKDKEYQSTKKSDDKVREDFGKNIKKFTQNSKQLKRSLDSVEKLKRELAVKKDLIKLNESFKLLLKSIIKDYKEENSNLKQRQKELEKKIIALENGYVKPEKSKKFKGLKSLKPIRKKLVDINSELDIELLDIKDIMLNE